MQQILIASAALALCAAAVDGGAYAEPAPVSVEDLVGARASGGELALVVRGYRFLRAQELPDSKQSTWWNAAEKVCLAVVTKNGRYRDITAQPASACGS